VQQLIGPTALISDCLQVVRELQRTIEHKLHSQLDHRSKNAGYARSMLQCDRFHHLRAVEKVKAHQQQHAGEAEAQQVYREANDLVDKFAKLGATMHEAPRSVAQATLSWNEATAVSVLSLAAAVLPLFPEERYERPPGGGAKQLDRDAWLLANGHRWAKTSAGWCCASCSARTSSREASRQHGQCSGKRALARAAERAEARHHLVQVICQASAVAVCLRCGATRGHWSILLRQPCPGAPCRGGVVALSRPASGRHPYQRSLELVTAVTPISLGQPPQRVEWDGRPAAGPAAEGPSRLERVVSRVRLRLFPG